MKTNSELIKTLILKGWVYDERGNLYSPSQTPSRVKNTNGNALKNKQTAKRKKNGEMNLTERRFFESYIQPAFLNGDIIKYAYENIRLKLAAGATYTPDFQVVTKAGKIEFYEIKNRFAWEDAIIKFKWVKKEYPEFSFYFVQYDKEKGWKLKYSANDSTIVKF